MDTGTYTFDGLGSKYSGFYSPCVSVSINDKELGKQYIVYEASAENTVENESTGIAVFKVVCSDNIGKEPKDYSILSAFPMMEAVEISMGYDDALKSVFKGYICERVLSVIGHEPPVLTVYCADFKSRLRLNMDCQTHKESKKWSDIVSKVLSKYSFQSDVTATPAFTKPMTVTQHGYTDYEYLCQIADKTGFEFFAFGGSIYFRKPMSVGGSIIKLSPNHITGLEYTTSLASAYSSVEYYGYNTDTKEASQSKAEDVTKKVGSGKTGAAWMDGNPAAITDNIHMNNKSSRDLEAEAKLLMQKASLSLVRLSVTTIGLPDIIPGRFMEIENMGGDLNNTYYIQSVKHEQSENNYKTIIECVSNTAAR